MVQRCLFHRKNHEIKSSKKNALYMRAIAVSPARVNIPAVSRTKYCSASGLIFQRFEDLLARRTWCIVDRKDVDVSIKVCVLAANCDPTSLIMRGRFFVHRCVFVTVQTAWVSAVRFTHSFVRGSSPILLPFRKNRVIGLSLIDYSVVSADQLFLRGVRVSLGADLWVSLVG